MATYAMICDNRVIEILYNQKVKPVWPATPTGKAVIAVECSEEATREWAYDRETGAVYKPIPAMPEEPIAPKHTQLDRIEEKLSILAGDSMTQESIEAAILEGVNEV